jgi:hypothetical protein
LEKNCGAIAHSSPDGRLHLLEEHLHETSRLAGEFAAVFDAEEWGRLMGLWHVKVLI